MFLNITMLAGLGGAVVPLVLHLLHRARFRSVDWGAMMFLQGEHPRRLHSARIKEILLLIVRMAIVALLAIALARPQVRASLGGLAQDGAVTAVLVIDRSESMAFESNGRTRMDQATDAAVQVLRSLRKGDQAIVLTLGGTRRDEPGPPTTDLQSLAADVRLYRASAGVANIADGISRAADLLDRYGNSNRELYVICDRQAVSWRQAAGAFATAFHNRLASAPARFYVIPVGGQEPDNVAIESFNLVTPTPIAGQSTDVEVLVHNYGSVPRAGLKVRVRGGDDRVTATINLAPGAEETVRLPVRFARAGSHLLVAAIDPSGLAADDRMSCAVEVSDPIHVLIISGNERAGGGDSAFLRLALMPFAAVGKSGDDIAEVTVKTAAEDWTDALRDARVVILADVPEISPVQARAMEQFVYSGGGLLVAPGSSAVIDNYNSALYRDGSGILPAMLRPPTPADGSASTSLLHVDLSHPVFRFLGTAPLPSAVFVRHFQAAPRPSDAQVLATFADGGAFFVESGAGRGRVILATAPLDSSWSTVPLTNFYLPMVQSAVRYLAASRGSSHNLAPGQPLIATFDEPIQDRLARVRTPDRAEHAVQSSRWPGHTELRFTGTDEPGEYQLLLRTGLTDRIIEYAVQPQRAGAPSGAGIDESDLTPLTDEQWQRLSETLGFHLIDPTATAVADALSGSRSAKELWGVLLIAAVALGIGEIALTRFWSRGGA